MNPMKIKILSELLDHLNTSQGMSLKSLLDEESKPAPTDPVQEVMEGAEEDPLKPKGISVEKVSVMGKPEEEKDPMAAATAPEGMGESMDQEMSDDELEELLKRLT